MAEESGQDKTEPPTPRRREEARRQGQVAVSQDLNGGLILLAGILLLTANGESLARGLLDTLRRGLLDAPARPDFGPDAVPTLFLGLILRGLELVGPLLGMLFAAGVGAGVLQVGIRMTPDLLTVKPERLSPAEGLQRLFSLQTRIRAVTSLLKLVAVGAVAYFALSGQGHRVAVLGAGSLAANLALAWQLVARVAQALAWSMFIIGVFDYVLQRYRFEQSLKMTRQEVKEEMKQEEGDPLIKARLRRIQRERAQRRMLQDVPKATVVITNPVHLAIALQYDRATMPAPRVVAKGAGEVARRITEVARRHAVPVVERAPLAQALFRAVEVGREIPANLYQVVAEVLAYIFRLRGGI